MLTMLLGGLWHGAAWTFVVWGGLHGLYLSVHRVFRRRTDQGEDDLPRLRELPAVVATFTAVCFAWIFFRAETFGQAFDVIAGIVTFREGAAISASASLVARSFLLMLAIDVFERVSRGTKRVLTLNPIAVGIGCAVALASIIVWSGSRPEPFIYFQF